MKKVRIGINGFGRIGRVAARLILERPNLQLVAINSRANCSSHAYLLQYDTTYKKFSHKVKFDNNYLKIDNNKISVYNFDTPKLIPWDNDGVQIVVDSTGIFRTSDELIHHLKKGVKQVILSAPAKDATKTLVLGVNEKSFNLKKDNIVSNSSCTTNCLATTLKVLNDKFQVKNGFMTTIHAVTDSQNLLDNSHKKEIRLRRSAFANAIPSSTGSAKDISKLFPALTDKIICQAIRIPLLTVSLINLTVQVAKKATVEDINEAFESYSRTSLKGILAVVESELVSSDFVGTTYSSIIDPFLTKVLRGKLVNVYAWYDNEWGYASRLVDLIEYCAKRRKLI